MEITEEVIKQYRENQRRIEKAMKKYTIKDIHWKFDVPSGCYVGNIKVTTPNCRTDSYVALEGFSRDIKNAIENIGKPVIDYTMYGARGNGKTSYLAAQLRTAISTSCLPIKVIFNDPATIVFWDDGTKTVVKCQPGDTYSKEMGLALCFAKKSLGNQSNFNNVFNHFLDENKDN